MSVDVILGLQWGDEGKGKIVDLLAPRYDIVARFQGGPNAGHTIQFDQTKIILHTIPSGISSPGTINVIGNGVIIDPYIFKKEVAMLEAAGISPVSNLLISKRAHLIVPSHRLLDAVCEKAKGDQKIGSTLKGIGPAYTDKFARRGLRIGDLQSSDFDRKLNALETEHLQQIKAMGFHADDFQIENMAWELYKKMWKEALETLLQFSFIDSEIMLNTSIQQKKTILAEGAQGTLLDVDFGSYPFVTSSNTSTGGVCTGLGIPPSAISKVYGIFKAYCTRVGNGPFPTELFDENGTALRQAGNEFGSTTGRPRRCGWLDLPALRYSIMINGVTDLIITKSDVLKGFKEIFIGETYNIDNQSHKLPQFTAQNISPQVHFKKMNSWDEDLSSCDNFDQLPSTYKQYIEFLEMDLNTPVRIISTGPSRHQTIERQSS